MPQGRIASGDIYPSRFAKLSTTDGKATQCGSNERPFGISQLNTRRSEYIDTSGKAAAAGEPILIYDNNEECLLELGGTVTQNDVLKSDANGKGVVAGTDKDKAGARAMRGGVSGEIIPVKVDIVDIAV